MERLLRKILLIDDSVEDRTIFRRFMSQDRAHEYRFLEAGTAAAALDCCREEQPDCVLLDLNLPDATGTELLGKIEREFGRNQIPVVMLSGSGDIETAVAAIKHGAHDYLIKNRANAEDLKHAVDNAIEKARLVREQERAENALRQSEERYRLLFETNPFPSFLFDRETRRIFAVNDAALQNYGYSLPEFLSLTIEDLHPIEDLSGLEHYRQISAYRLSDTALPFRHRKKDGSVINVEISYHTISFNNRQARLVVAQDVTERKRLEAEREELLQRAEVAREQAELANRAKDEFLAILSHELRTPLNAMYGWAKLLKENRLDQEKTRHALDVIERNINLQNNLIEDLLDVSRIISGKMRIEPIEIDLLEVIASSLETARLQAAGKNIRLETDFQVETAVVNGDAARLQQVVSNLLNNAIKFTSTGGLITVSVSKIGNRFRLSVKDSGIGISKQFLPFVFARFKQADSSSKRKYSGLGLGLTIVKNIVEMHDGTVAAFSDGEGTGATFIVELPLVNRQNAALDAEQVKTFADVSDHLALQNKRILLVDDDAESLLLLKSVLQQNGATIVAVQSANRAWQEFGQHDFDLLVSDIAMPEMDGLDLIRRVRAAESNKQKTVPAIAVTAFASAEERQQILAAGFQLHIAKPFNVEQVPFLLRDLIDK